MGIETADRRVPRSYVAGVYFMAVKVGAAPPPCSCLWRGPGGGWVCCSLLCGCCRAVGPQCRLQPQPSIDPGVTSPRRKPATSETNSGNQSWLTANNCNPLSTQAGIRSPSIRRCDFKIRWMLAGDTPISSAISRIVAPPWLSARSTESSYYGWPQSYPARRFCCFKWPTSG